MLPWVKFFDVLAHSGVLPQELSLGEGRQRSQARMVGEINLVKHVMARELAEPESARTTAQLRDWPDHRASASETRERWFAERRKGPVEKGPGRSTSGEEWKDLAIDSSSSDQARPLPTNSHPQSTAAMPDSAPASCNGCTGEKTAAGT